MILWSPDKFLSGKPLCKDGSKHEIKLSRRFSLKSLFCRNSFIDGQDRLSQILIVMHICVSEAITDTIYFVQSKQTWFLSLAGKTNRISEIVNAAFYTLFYRPKCIHKSVLSQVLWGTLCSPHLFDLNVL